MAGGAAATTADIERNNTVGPSHLMVISWGRQLIAGGLMNGLPHATGNRRYHARYTCISVGKTH
jgi:hypothetical protein